MVEPHPHSMRIISAKIPKHPVKFDTVSSGDGDQAQIIVAARMRPTVCLCAHPAFQQQFDTSCGMFDLVKELLIHPGVAEAARKSLNESLLKIVSPLNEPATHPENMTVTFVITGTPNPFPCINYQHMTSISKIVKGAVKLRLGSTSTATTTDLDLFADAFIQSCKVGHAALVYVLINSGVNVNCGRGQGLVAATKYRRSDVVEVLVKAGAEIGCLCRDEKKDEDEDEDQWDTEEDEEECESEEE
ncbi:hypothetical protein HK102_012947 [Quaeritorhiza haematococci]|nr:hypothetical protein HK102_012947 [Quaeritorhiza haematococci]